MRVNPKDWRRAKQCEMCKSEPAWHIITDDNGREHVTVHCTNDHCVNYSTGIKEFNMKNAVNVWNADYAAKR